MSKTTTITINNLHITVGAASSGSRMSDLLGAMLGSIHLVPADENGNNDDAPVVDTLKGDLVAFLQPNEHFDLRTLAAIQKKFNSRTLSDLHTALHELVEDNVLYTKRRRSDGETLYGAIAQAYVDVPAQQGQQTEPAADTTNVTTGEAASAAETSAPATTLTVDEIVEFLECGEYELRSLDAIRKAFGEFNHNDIAATLQIAVGSGKVYTRRRSDGATLYGAA